MTTLLRWYYRLWCWLTLRCGLYYAWSRLWRRLFLRRYAKPVEARQTVDECVAIASNSMLWSEDRLADGWDVIAYARKLEESGKGDCDEHAAWWLEAGRDGLQDSWGEWWFPVGLLTVSWGNGGHNVALFRKLNPFHTAYGSNDRFICGGTNYHSIASEIAAKYYKLPLAYCLVSADLIRVISYRWVGGS